MKTCSVCHNDKADSEFYGSHHLQCKPCFRQITNEKYRLKHPRKKKPMKEPKIIKSKIQNWKPKVGQEFDAFLLDSHRRHYCSPFVRIDPPRARKRFIYADEWQFDTDLFYFVPVNKQT